MKWQKGRQETDYEKLRLYSFRIWKLGFDAYVLKYKPDTYLKLHRDPVPSGKHWRLNIGWGDSQFYICDYPRSKCGIHLGKFSLYFFRPDVYLHGLSVYGKTYKLSLGFVKFE